MYGQDQYGVYPYGSRKDVGDREEYNEDLLKLVPEFMAGITELRELYTAQGYEAGYVHHAMEDVIGQCFIATATWGMGRWEQAFGMEPNFSLTYEQRREILMAKLRGQGTTTVNMIKNTAAAFSGGEVEVIEDNPNHCFIVRFIGIKGIPRNMQGFMEMLEEIKPAHMAYRFEYRYTVWNELPSCTWNELGKGTWEDARILKEG